MRKRKWWIAPGILLLLVGLGWWRVNAPPPLPRFLEPFQSKTQLYASGVNTHEPGSGIEIKWLVDSPADAIVLAIADEIGDENVVVGEGFAFDARSEEGFALRAVVRGKRRQTIVRKDTRFESTSKLDQWIGNLWFGWWDLRFAVGGIEEEWSVNRDPAFSRYFLKQKRPKLRLWEPRKR
ncbi:MAG: hypothetical protein ABL962_15980 [Fimbriimonadaceae bacterium]